MPKQVLDTPDKLKRALYQIKAMNALSGGPVPDIPDDLGWEVAEICAYFGLEVQFVLKDMK